MVQVVFHEIVSKRPPDATSRKRRASLVGCLVWLDREWPALRATLPADRIALFDLGLFALLSYVLEIAMRLLHPFMPFLTEELWGVTAKRDEILALSDWPLKAQAAPIIEPEIGRAHV